MLPTASVCTARERVRQGASTASNCPMSLKSSLLGSACGTAQISAVALQIPTGLDLGVVLGVGPRDTSGIGHNKGNGVTSVLLLDKSLVLGEPGLRLLVHQVCHLPVPWTSTSPPPALERSPQSLSLPCQGLCHWER